MRLHQLVVSAFGPYPDRIEVDCDALGEAGLFLLHGHTGAGKTSLLDAVAFALYGTVPGARGEVKRLRCDSAQPRTRTQVELELTVAGQRIRLVRSPEYRRPKSRGAGTTVEKAKVVLSWLDGDREPLTSHREVGDAVLDLLGMSADQFFQVVLLPQGEFARFLRADTAERERLLEKLFDTERFADIERCFADLRRESRQRTQALVSRVEQQHARLAQACGRELAADISAAELDELVADLAATADAAHVRCGVAQQEWVTANEQAAKAELRAERVATLRALLAEQADLVDAEEALTHQQEAVDAARRATPVLLHRQHAETADQTLAAARADERHARLHAETVAARVGEDAAGRDPADLLQAVEQFGQPADADRLRQLAGGDREAAGALAELLTEAEADTADRRQAEAMQTELEQLLAEQAAADADSAALPGLIERVTVARQAAADAAAGLPGLEQELSRATDIHTAAAALPALLDAERKATQASQAAVDRHQQATAQRLQLLEMRLAGMAAELAGQLQDGQPCGVCGSHEHPQLAVAVADPVTANMLADAAALEGAAQQTREAAEQVARRVAAERLVAEERADGCSLEQAVDRLAVATAQLNSARVAAQPLHRLNAEVAALTRRAATQADRQQQLVAAIATIRAELASVLDRVRARKDRLRAAAAPFDTVAQRRAHLIELANARDTWAVTLQRVADATVLVTSTKQRLKLAVEEAGFADLNAAVAAASVDIEAIAASMQLTRDRRISLDTRLAAPELAGISATERVDPQPSVARREQAQQASERAIAAAETATRMASETRVAVEGLLAARRVLAPSAVADAEITALAEVVAGRGQNHRALSLRSFVLAARLQQVAAVAGQRLAVMSAGRYSFVHSTAKESRGRSGGLGLDILDAHTGAVRPTKTLSGGESFLASLALALGLADVVAGEAGGRILDTVFIDEGFGTLDAESLDLVMSTLDDLRTGGRTVGLVSHVDDLRQRIPTRLHIRRTLSGPLPVLETDGS